MSNESCISAAPSQRPTSALCCLLTLLCDTDRSCVFRRLRRYGFGLKTTAEKQALHFADASGWRPAPSRSPGARGGLLAKSVHQTQCGTSRGSRLSQARSRARSQPAQRQRHAAGCRGARARAIPARATDDYRKGPSNCAISSRRARAAASFATAPRRAAHPDGNSHVPAEAALAGSLTRAPLRQAEMRSRSEPYM